MISIITATYNCKADLEKFFIALKKQSCDKFELLIADGGSTDGTLELISEYSDHIAWWISEQDSGIYNAWNKALKHTRGEWIFFLGADDTFYDESTLDAVCQQLEQLPHSTRTFYGKLLSVNEDGEQLAIAGRGWQQDKSDFFTYAKPLPHPAMFQRRLVFEELGGFDEEYKISADFEFMCRELKNHEAHFCDIFIAVHMLRGVSVHPKTALRSWKETLRIISKHQLNIPLSFKLGRILKASVFYLAWLVLPEKIIMPAIDRLRRHYWKKR